MKMKFSLRLYKEGLGRIRLPGIIIAVLVLFASAVSPISMLVDSLLHGKTGDGIEQITITQLMSPMIIILFAVMLLAATSFSFLNDRCKSDFYHSLPYHRTSLFVHFTLGILTWTWGTMIGCMTIRAILFAINPYVVFSFGNLMLGLLVYAIATLMMLGYILLSMTLTGTRFSGALVFGLLMLLMRIVGSQVSGMIAEALPHLASDSGLLSLLQWKKFLPYALLQSFIFTSGIFTDTLVLVYSAVCAIAMLFVAALVFLRRRSESAGMSTIHPLVQDVFRCAFALPFLLFSVACFLRKNTNDVIIGFVLLFVTFAVYLLYELITVKKWKSVLSACKIFPIVLLLGVAVAFTVVTEKNIELKRTLKADEIESVSLGNIRSDFFFNFTFSYEDIIRSNFRFSEQSVCEMIAHAYADTVSAVGDGEYENLINYDEKYGNETLSVIVRLKNKKEKKYNLLIEKNARIEFEALLQANDIYREKILEMPKTSDVFFVSIAEINKNVQESVWRVFLEEYNALSDEEKSMVKNYNEDAVTRLSVSGFIGTETFTSNYSVPPTMKNTVKKLAEVTNSEKDEEKEQDNAAFVLSKMNEEEISGDKATTLHVRLYTGGEWREYYFYGIVDEEISNDLQTNPKMQKMLDEMKIIFRTVDRDSANAFDPEKPYLIVSASAASEGKNGVFQYRNAYAYLNISEEGVSELLAFATHELNN